MTMSRWRLATKAFLIFNLAMVGLVLAVLWSVFGSSPCDLIPNGPGYANDHTACAMGEGFAGAFRFIYGMAAIAVLWPIGLIIIVIAWVRGRGGRARRASHLDALREHLRGGTMEAEAPTEETQDDAPDADD